jgi:tRNA threonylcarbamoyladenosine biosynthesis protein TsaE
MMMGRRERVSTSLEDTFAIGRGLGSSLTGAENIYLKGEIGSGKTMMAKGIAMGIGVADPGMVTSPTFTLVNEYRGRYVMYHLDLFRINHAGELADLGIEDMFDGPGIVVVEWPELLLERYAPDISVELTYLDETRRRIVVEA